jgi:hypothetical protein
MWTAIAGGLFRTFGAVLAGFLVARGQIDASDAETIVGALGALAVAGASAYDKVKRK